MEGAHRGGRRVKGGVVGSKSEASARQKRAQCGAAASGRRGQAVQIARAKVAEASSEDKAVEEEVARAMQQGNGLVQATLEHLETDTDHSSTPRSPLAHFRRGAPSLTTRQRVSSEQTVKN